MAYLETDRVQKWLQNTKYDLGGVEQGWEDAASGVILGKIQQRYDISAWVDSDTTPELILEIMSMQVAAFYIRMVASEEDGLTSYADVLERRIYDICEGIVEGNLILAGETYSTTNLLGSGPSFFPDNSATNLYDDNRNLDGSTDTVGAAPRVFGMGDQF